MSLIQWIDFKEIGDDRGCLVALESNRDIPFTIERVYYLYNLSSDLPRGFHAHRELVQVAICLSGSCNILMDDGSNKINVDLNSRSKGLLIDVMQWHEMRNFSEDCVLLVLASDIYRESDYIRDYKCFLEEVKGESSSIKRRS